MKDFSFLTYAEKSLVERLLEILKFVETNSPPLGGSWIVFVIEGRNFGNFKFFYLKVSILYHPLS